MESAGAGKGLDAAAFAELYARHRDDLHRYCRARLGDTPLVEDVVQDVFERAFARRAQFDPNRRFWPWLAAIAGRACIDAHRRTVTAREVRQRYQQEVVRPPSDLTSTAVMRAFEQRRLADEIARLPARQRAALGLFALDGWSYEAIGRHLGYSTKAVKALIQRARATLRESATRWVAGGAGLGRAARERFRRQAARLHTAWWPSDVAAGWTAHGLAAASVVTAVMLTVGGATIVGRGADAAEPRPESGVAMPRTELSAAAPTSATASATHNAPVQVASPTAPSAPRSAPAAAAERLGNELVGSVAPGSGSDPESVHVQSFATSPDYESDPAVFVAGEPTVGMKGASVPLFVSHDDGGSWSPRRALGLAPVVKLLLAPAYPQDPRVFAITLKGLQVSNNDGDTFETLVPLTGASDAAVSPRFADGDSSILVVAGGRLWRYDERTGAVQPVLLAGDLASHVVNNVGYAVGEDGERVVLVGTRLHEVVRGDPGFHVSRCSSTDLLTGVASTLRCTTTRLPFFGSASLSLHSTADRADGLVFAALPTRPLVSSDGGRTFRPARPDGYEESVPYEIHDLAAVPSRAGAAVVAQTAFDTRGGGFRYGAPLVRTDDGGGTWTPLFVDLPRFDWGSHVIVTPTGRIVAGSGHGGLACSPDGGRSWGRACGNAGEAA
ncbi:MAG TPA: sigma-70 family RNA polymerase sigma factor [Acidimicrobiales bacterium]